MNELGWIKAFALIRAFLGGVEEYFIASTAWHYVKSLGQTMLFLAVLMCAYHLGAIVASSVAGFITDREGNPRSIFIFACILRAVACVVYSVNLSEYFPLLGRLFSELADMSTAVLFGQIALQANEESRGGNFVLVEAAYCLGAAFGRRFGNIIAFQMYVFGWKIDEDNSPGIVLSIIWLVFLIFSLVAPKDIWMKSNEQHSEINSSSRDDEAKKCLNKGQSGRQDPKSTENDLSTAATGVFRDPRVWLLNSLVFCSELYSRSSTSYVAVSIFDRVYLQLIRTEFLFLNCTIITSLVFICLYFVSEYVDERKLVGCSIPLQIYVFILLTCFTFSPFETTDTWYYISFSYICCSMPYFLYPFVNSLLSKIANPRNATSVQGLSYASLHFAILMSRVVIIFVLTKTYLTYFYAGMIVVCLVVFIIRKISNL